MKKFLAGAAIALTASVFVLAGSPAEVGAKEFLVTGAKPDKLLVIDAKAREVVKTHTIPNAAPGLLTVTPSPDGKTAYAIVNGWESVSGIDLDSGKEVFRADFSKKGVRSKAMFGMDISPDGKELFVFLSPVKLGLGEYEVQDVHIAVYNTADGVGAQPVRTLPAPRRTALLLSSTDGTKLYAVSWDIVEMDPKTGKVTGTHKIRNWGRENYSEPDVLDVWPQFEQSGIFSTPYYAVRTDLSPDDPAAYKTGLVTLDLKTGAFEAEDFEDTSVVIFSSAINPVRRNEVYMVYTQLTKMDRDKHEVVKRIDLDHTYYCLNVSKDGSEIYLAGTMNDIAVYSTDSFERIGTIQVPGGADLALASIRVVDR